LASYGFAGTVTRNEGDKLRDVMEMQRGQQVNDAVLANARQAVSHYFREKGYLKADARIEQKHRHHVGKQRAFESAGG
jgi:hemolysin activation/secretion protein